MELPSDDESGECVHRGETPFDVPAFSCIAGTEGTSPAARVTALLCSASRILRSNRGATGGRGYPRDEQSEGHAQPEIHWPSVSSRRSAIAVRGD
jgi:hypothetical protein